MTQDYLLFAAFLVSMLALACASLAVWLVPSDEEIGRRVAKEVKRQIWFWRPRRVGEATEEAAWKSLRGEKRS